MALVKPRLLWFGDAVVNTGFAKVTHSILPHLLDEWEIHVVGLNFMGDPGHSYPYPIYPASSRGDLWGLNRFTELLNKLLPDAIVILNDSWIAARFASEFNRGHIPMAAYMPVDARNIPPYSAERLNALDLAIFYTKFGENECRQAGFTGLSEIVPHGVDTKIYRPLDRQMCRYRLNFSQSMPGDSFIFGNVNRNSPRKRLDLSIQYFSEWVHQRRIPKNVFLYLHCSQQDQARIDAAQLASYYGVYDRLMLPPEDNFSAAEGFPEWQMPYVYSCMDVQISTTLGEGWGLSTIESMACGVPQIVPQYSALGEWAAGAVHFVPCTSHQTHIQINTIGGVADKDAFIEALDIHYRNPELRAYNGAKALTRAMEPQFRWEAVGDAFRRHLGKMLIDAHERVKKEKEAEDAKVSQAGQLPEEGNDRPGSE